jgi:hypothetical protein
MSPHDRGKIMRMEPYGNTYRTRPERGEVYFGIGTTMVQSPAVLTRLETTRPERAPVAVEARR